MNCFAIRIREQRKGDAFPVREFIENRDVVVAHANDLNVYVLKLLNIALQLYQLLLAERSPVGRAVEDNGHVSLIEQFGKGDIFVGLILEREFRSFHADGDARCVVVR